MSKYTEPLYPFDTPETKICKTLLASYTVNDNINQPIGEVILKTAYNAGIDASQWTGAKTRGIWMRTAADWNQRAEQIGIQWGTKKGTQNRSSEITTKIETISGEILSCRPLERIESFPCPLVNEPSQVFILTVASEIMLNPNGKVRAYIQGPLSLYLKLSERLVRACIYSSFRRTASVLPALGSVHIRQFLLAPMSQLAQHRFLPSPYSNNAWLDQSIRPVCDGHSLQILLDNGNNGTDTLILLAHGAYNHTGWNGWAVLMRKMSACSSLGVAFVADRDVTFERDRSLYGRDGLDYIIAVPNYVLQSLAVYLSTRQEDGFPSIQELADNTTITREHIISIDAINRRATEEPGSGPEAIQGRSRYPGEAVKLVFAVDEV